MMGRKDLYNLESLYMLSAIAEYQGKRQAAEMLGISVEEAVNLGAGIGMLSMRFKDSGLVCLDNICCMGGLMFYLITHRKAKDVQRVRAVINYYHKFMELL